MPSQASSLVLGTLGLALVAVLVGPVWNGVTRYLDTFVHESSHALLSILTGNWVKEIQIDSRGGGHVVPDAAGPVAGIVIGLAGYSGPSVAGLGLAAAAQYGVSARTVLLVLIALVLLTLFPMANRFGVLVLTVILLVLALLLHRAGPVSQGAALVAGAWLLLVAGVRSAVEVVPIRRSYLDRGRRPSSDADILYDITGIPPDVWVALWIGFTVAALAIGARWLLF